MQSNSNSTSGRLISPLQSKLGSSVSPHGRLAASAADCAGSAAGLYSPSATAKEYSSSRSQQSSPHGQISPTRRPGRDNCSPAATHRAPPGRLSATAAGSPRSPHKKLTIAQYQSASSEALQSEVQLVQNALCACQAAYSKALADVNKSTAKIQQLEQQVKSLQQEDAALSAKVPLPVNRLCRVRQWLSEKVTALDAEQAALEGKQMALLKAESKLRSQETEASLLDETATNLSAAAAAGAAAATHEAAEKHDREVAGAKRQLMLMATQQQQAQQAAVQEQQEADRRSRTAIQCQTVARERLAGSLTAIKSGAGAAAEAAAGQHARHMESLLQLKAKVDEVREATSKNAEKARQLRKQKKEQEQREFGALQEQGLNPYEIYRVRDAEAAAAQAAAQQASRQRQRKAEIAAALEAEDRAHRRQVAKQEFDRQVEENYQRQMGITAQQQRTDAYMRAHTLTHQAILDPTSRVPVYPSDAVLVKPVGFGLGRSSPEAVRKVAAKHGQGAVDLEDCLLLPSKYRSSSSSPSRKQPHRQLLGGAGADIAQPHDDSTAAAGLPDDLSGSEADDGGEAASRGDADSDAGRNVDAPSSGGIGAPGACHGDASSSGKQGRQQRGRQMQLQTAKLSKYEAGKLEQAKQRHKAHIAQPKAAFGRVFAGDAFISDPPVVVFKDFVPGQTYKASVQLINRSFTGSSIRLLEVPTEVMHVLELDMPPSGCLAPGASATLKVTFKPLADEPFSASIPLLADSGPLGVPFKALVRQALPSIDPSPVVSVDGRAGGVMLGASGHTTATISNAGVLSMLYSVKVTGPLASTTEYEELPGPVPPADASEEDLAALQAQTWSAASLSVAGIRVQGVKGQVGGYSSSSFVVEFTPRVAGPVEVPVLVSFTAPDFKGLAIPPIALTLTATGKDLPVSTLTPVVDFKCVMFGQSYAAPLLLANAGKSAMKVLVSARPELSEWLTFTPDFGFIQTSDTLAVSVTLKPTPDMTHKLAKYLMPQQQDTFEIQIQVNVPGQPLPLPVKIKLQATTSDLILSPITLEFGRVPLTEAAGVYITISNPSALPQGFSFGSKLPLGLTLSPNAGYGRVLPHATVKLLASFQPPIPGVQYFDLTCRSLSGRLFRLEGKADGLQPDVSLSHNVIRFPATACEDSSSASLIIRNSSSDSSQLFEFGVPQGSHLKVTPRVGLLPPQSSMRVQVDFSPPARQLQLAAAAGAATAAGAAAGAAVAAALVPNTGSGAGAPGAAGTPATQPPPQQPQSQQQQLDEKAASSGSGHYQEWLLPCFVKRAPNPAGNTNSSITGSSVASLPNYLQTATLGAAAADHSTGTGSSSSNSAGDADYILHVSATTCCIRPELHLVSSEMPKPPGKNYWVLDFGALPVGERATRELLLQNTGADVASLVAVPMDPLIGAFSIVNALRPLDANGGKGRLLLAFSPPDCCEYQEILTLRSSKSRLRVCLRGQGIAPTLSVSPATATAATGGLSFGDVLLSDPVCKELKVQVTNTCPFTINYSTRFIGPAPQQHEQVAQQQQQQGAAGGSKSRPASAAKGTAAGVKPAAAAGPPAAAGAPAAAAGPGKQLGGVVVQQQGAGAAPAAAASAAAVTPQTPPVATAEGVGIPSGCFVCKPCGGVLLAGQTQELTVVFAPLGSPGVSMQGNRGPCGPLGPYVSDRLQVLVPHQQQDVVIPLHGNAWPDGVFVSGAAYKPSSSSSTAAKPSAAGSAAGPVQDPFAAIMVAAASVALPPAPAPATSAGSAQGAKGKQAAAAATASQEKDKQGSQQQLPSLQPKDVQSALAAAGYCDLAQGYVILPGPVSPGQITAVTVDFGAVKSSAGGAAGDLVVEELTAEAKQAGWSVDPVKLSTPAGEKKPLTVRFTAPAAAKLSGTALEALAQLQLPVQQTVKINLVLKGGCQAMGAVPAAVAVAADGTRRMTLVCSCVLAPAQGDVAAAAAAPGSGDAAAAPAAAVKK